ncbi:MAG: hypothetical protein SPK32_07130 [Bacteroidaceae bacterium]|nr:hypothetical protein [Bacteroidaceae bacterium]
MNRIQQLLALAGFTLLMAGLPATSANAQSKAATKQETPDLQQQAKDQTAEMVKRYNLDEGQAAALQALNLSRLQSLAEIDAAIDLKKANAAQKAEIKKMKAEVQAGYNSVIKDILSEKQYAKYLEDEEKNKETIKGNVNWLANIASRELGENNVNLLGWNGNISDSLKIATEATDKLAKKYKLSDEQREKLLALNIAEVSAEIAERRSVTLEDATPTEMAEKTQEFIALAKKRSANYERYLKEIFTEEQYKKYTNVKKAQQTRRTQRPPMMRMMR